MENRPANVPSRRVSIKVKLAALIAAVAMLVLSLGIGVMGVLQYRDAVASNESRLRNLIEVIAAAAGAPLAFDDAPGAAAVLDTLRRLPDLAAARLTTPGGKPLAQLEIMPGGLNALTQPSPSISMRAFTGAPLASQLDMIQINGQGDWLHRVTMPVMTNGDVLGRASFAIDQRAIRALQQRLVVGGLLLAAALAVAVVLLSLVVQRLVTAPLIALTDVMREISKTGNYERSVSSRTNDELGDLAQGFNQMLGQIRERDARLAGYNEALEGTVRERTSELAATVDQLRAAKDKAEAASRAKSQFLANMSHEIRTPMNGVLGTADLMAFTELNERQTQLLGIMQRSGQSLLALLNDILDFSKIEAGKLELECLRFDLRELVHEIAELFATSAHQKGLKLDLHYPPELPATLNTDPSRLRQVLVNLLGNALKFTERGSVTLAIEPQRGADGLPRVMFSVIDTGVGIPEQALNRIFEEFAQADGSMSRRFGGTGLGLTISRQLVVMMGGRIEVDSREGRGSTFRFALPTEPAGAAGRVLPPPVPTQDPDVARHLAGLMVVSCIGEPQLREFVQSHLAAWRIPSQSFGSAPALLDYLGSVPGSTEMRLVLVLAEGGQPFELIAQAMSALSRPGTELAGLVVLSSQGPPADFHRDARFRHLPLPLRVSALLERLIEFGDPTGRRRSADLAPRDALPRRFDARVLVAEDHPVNQVVTRGQLENLGCEVVMVANGREAVEASARERFDLILMDCQMPEMDGFEATAAIRHRELSQAAEGGLRQPVVALTAHALKGDREACLAAGMDDYLMKPFKSDQLQAILVRWLPVRPAAGGADLTPGILSSGPSIGSKEDTMTALPPTPTAADGAAEPAFDIAALQALQEADPEGMADLLDEIAGIYEDDAVQRVAAIATAALAGDAEAVHRNSHPLASASGSLGLLHMQALCREIDGDARQGRVAAALARQHELPEALDAARAWLTRQRLAYRSGNAIDQTR